MLSSLSLFKGIVVTHKGDVWAIVRDFIVATLKKSSLSVFSISDLREAMAKEFNIDIENAVLKKVLDNLALVSYNSELRKYETTPALSSVETQAFDMELADSQRQCEELEEELYSYYCKENNLDTIEEKDKILLKDYFFRYLIDKEVNQNNEITVLVNSFALQFETTSRKKELISNIRQGLIMLEGLNYSKATDDKTWKYETTFFLDAHYLFSLFDLNSSYHRGSVKDFIELAKKINDGAAVKHNARKRIVLTYFPETRVLMDKFFKTAFRIKNGDETLKPYNEAMRKIVEKCNEPEDVSALKTRFYKFLKEQGIDEYPEKIQLEEGKDYLYETSELKMLVEKSFPEEEQEEVYNMFLFADYINILREGRKVRDLEACRCIFLTDKTLGVQVSKFLKKNDEQARTHVFEKMEWFTQRMWYLTCQSLTYNKNLTTFDLAIKAKMVLSGICQSNVADIYEKLKEKNRSQEENSVIYEDMRTYQFSADSIDASNSKSKIDQFSAGALEQYHKAYLRMADKAKRTDAVEEELDMLTRKLKDRDEDVQNLNTTVKGLIHSNKYHRIIEIVVLIIIIALMLILILK